MKTTDEKMAAESALSGENCKRLRLIVSDDNHRNLFVRLSPSTVEELLSASLATIGAASKSGDDESRCWSSQNDFDQTFLPLMISIDEHKIYASFNGGALDVPGTR